MESLFRRKFAKGEALTGYCNILRTNVTLFDGSRINGDGRQSVGGQAAAGQITLPPSARFRRIREEFY